MNDPSTAKSEHRALHFVHIYCLISVQMSFTTQLGSLLTMTLPPWANIPVCFLLTIPLSYLTKKIEFINENIAAKGGLDRWNYIFRIACQLEAKLFNTGLQSPTPFQIIPDGTYSIQISSVESVVLAIQNVKGLLRPPLDKLLGGYFPSDAGLSVVGTKKTGLDNERVRVDMYCSLFVLELTNYIVAHCCNQSWIYVPKLGDWPLSRNLH